MGVGVGLRARIRDSGVSIAGWPRKRTNLHRKVEGFIYWGLVGIKGI